MYRGVQKLLAATGPLMVDVGTVDGHTPLHIAAVNGLRQIAQVLVETVSLIMCEMSLLETNKGRSVVLRSSLSDRNIDVYTSKCDGCLMYS